MKYNFEKIYADGAWGKGSGSGSRPEFTATYREFLQAFMKEHGIKRVFDIGCGDWQFSQFIDWSGIEYTGIDVVSPVIKANHEQFSAHNIKFVNADVLQTGIDVFGPFEETDLIISKDVLQHWPNWCIEEFLRLVVKFPGHFLLTNDRLEPGTDNFTTDIQNPGGWRRMDITAPPFNFPGKEVFALDVHKRTIHGRFV